ncbi:E1-like protein-activating enzyme G [Capsaspora owczarzaki ATCC 30864]|nr:E1-like protein-activating enzyme G [Capsaspora owczarzaki ATCC 30864]|eukprot:XP_004364215.1 E1-like protein-activating enzyme G [Capsaspora owczarzaki ATCC 30864]
MAPLQFAPFSSAVDASFWHMLSRQKLDVYKLSDEPHPVLGYYTMGEHPDMPARVCVNQAAFAPESAAASSSPSSSSAKAAAPTDLEAFFAQLASAQVASLPIPTQSFPALGTLFNANTADAFKEFDKKAMLEDMAKKMWGCITSGAAIKHPALLNRFLLLCFADLKKYHFYYWFAFPALYVGELESVAEPAPLFDTFSASQMASFQASHAELSRTHPDQAAFFLVSKVSDDKLQAHALADWAAAFPAEATDDITIGFADPCALAKNPGWPLRNLLLLLSHWKGYLNRNVRIICYREVSRGGELDLSQSIVLTVRLTPLSAPDLAEGPKVVGWEKNAKQKLGPRIVDLSSSMDPTRLAETAVDLNLKLMRWRLLPSLELEKISSTKCLLFGAGTLGCNVARALMGWGVRHITFVDNSRVSFSNPVRQTLFQFEDCLDGGKPKAAAAAAALKRIFPSMVSEGHNLSIPMPGHSVEGEEPIRTAKETVAKLEALIDEHDVIFLLMDTRESRWLPTLLAASRHKLVLNTALGFDTFVVMRHGIVPSPDHPATHKQLGCYFCNDVMAPSNSLKDRTLDQQCTVARPGMSFLAASLAVELLVSLLHHPLGASAPAASTTDRASHNTEQVSTELGLLPHQIRGFLSQFDNVLPIGHAFNRCTACSNTVVDAYRKEGFSFLQKAFNSPTFLEELTGLKKLHEETEAALADWDEDDIEPVDDNDM